MSPESGPAPKIAKVESGNDVQEQIAAQEAMLGENVTTLDRAAELLRNVLKSVTGVDPAEKIEITDKDVEDFEKRDAKRMRQYLDPALRTIEEMVEEVDEKFKERSLKWPVAGAGLGIIGGPMALVGGAAAAETVVAAIWGIQRVRLLIEEARRSKQEAV